MPNVVHDPFHRALKAKLDAMIEDAVDSLSNGTATQLLGEVTTTGEKYAAQVSQIRTLRIVLAMCEQVAEEIIRPARVEVKER